MSKISEYLNKIKTAIYGREVRDAIHDSIKECYTDVTSGATLANEASDKANAATEKANTAASNADTATASANSAANLANAAASNADNKAALADRATANANAATESANTAASSAADKAALADTAATGATAAMNSANEAASNADNKAALADEATANANAATESANTAAFNADNKAALADKATTDANNAANQANTAATTADDKAALADNAAGLIRRMNVSATSLPPGSTPTSLLNTVEDASGFSHYSLVLGIPTGNTGATPALTFEVSTGEAGTDATVEVTGTAEAPIVHLTIPKGDTGKVENLVINGKPVDSGTITLTAADIGALPADTAIPKKTSDLTNDSGFITADNAPVLSVNGKTGAVSLSAEDVGALSGTDETLAISGKAADAKKTGDSLNQLEDDIAHLLYDNAGSHNAIYRGKNLGTSVTAAQYAAIAAGTFDDLYIGDYWIINDVTYRIAAFDYYLLSGDASMNIHHVTLVPDDEMYTHVMNDTDITTGGYVGSKMYTVGLNPAKTTITNAFGASHVLKHRQYLCNAVTNGKPSGGSWYDSTVELMTEQNCYGGKVFGTGNGGSTVPALYTVDKSQYPLFAFRPDMISNRTWFWLRDVVSNTFFARVGALSNAFCASASGDSGVRPAFSIIG